MRLDEVSGASRFGRWFSWIGGYWNLLLGTALIVLAVVILLVGAESGSAVICAAFGVIALAVGLFIGPKYMVRRLLRRPVPPTTGIGQDNG
jgi:hypothetical protein